MKKVLSVALASAMVLGMGANAFAITYNTSTNDEADWPSKFQFDGELFVTDKDDKIITDATTALNDNEAVDFEPGDVIWMPLYANDQYEWSNTWTEGTDDQDAVSNIKLDASYFTAGTSAKDPSTGTKTQVTETVPVTISIVGQFRDGDGVNVNVGATYVGQPLLSGVTGTAGSRTGNISITLTETLYEAIYGKQVDNFVGQAITIPVSESTLSGSATGVVGTVSTAATNGQAQVAAQLKEIPTKLTVTTSSGKSVERTVESAKATLNGKTFTARANEFATLKQQINDELKAMAAAGKSAQIDDVTVVVNLAEVEGTDDVVNKPHIDVATDGNKVKVDYGHYTGNIDKNWSINLIEKSTGVAELIEKAELYKATATDFASYSKYTDEIMPNAVYLKVTMKDTWKTVDSETLTYYVYVADNDSGKQTNEVWVSGKYVNNDWEYVNFDWTNDASKAQLWKVKKGENGTAVFDFADKAFFTVKMYSGESMYLDLSTAYDKAIAGEMDAEADSFFKFDNDNANFSRTGELIIVTDDSSLVPYEIDEDGNFVEVDAKYVEDYAIAHTNKKVDGFVFSTKTLGNYVLSTEELGQEEQPVDETPVVEEPTTETPATDNTTSAKPNPETGAEDFVGLAVSLAVVSVAAAGALALKK